MFETSVIRAEVIGERRARMITMSFAFHGLVVIAIFAASIRNINFPTSSPREYAIPILTMPLTIPPALGTPNGGHKQATPPAPTKQKSSIPIANLAPANLPDHTVPAAATSTGEPATTGSDTGSDRKSVV